MVEEGPPGELPGSPMDNATSKALSSADKYKPVEPLELQGVPGNEPVEEQPIVHKPVKVTRKRRSSVTIAKEAIGNAGKAIGNKMKQAGKVVGGAAKATTKTVKKSKYDDTARDLNSRTDIQLAMKAAYGWVVAMFVICFICLVIELQILTKGYLESRETAPPGIYEQTIPTEVLKGVISFCSLISALFMIRYYQHYYRYLLITQGSLHIKRNRHWLRFRFLCEFLACCIHVPPGVSYTWFSWSLFPQEVSDESGFSGDIYYHIDIFNLLILVRVYLLPRSVLYFSELWSSNTVTFVASMNDVQITTSMAVKAIFSKHAVLMTLFTCVVPWICFAFMFSFCERLADPFWAEGGVIPFHAFYNLFLTFAGEVAAEPNTWCGRGATVMQVLIGLLGTVRLALAIMLHLARQA